MDQIGVSLYEDHSVIEYINCFKFEALGFNFSDPTANNIQLAQGLEEEKKQVRRVYFADEEEKKVPQSNLQEDSDSEDEFPA